MKPRQFSLPVATLLLFLASCSASLPPAAQSTALAAEEKAAKTPSVGDTAPDFELSELKGAKIKLSTLAEKSPVVLVMLRGYPGYQCPFCTAQVGQLLQQSDKLAKAKVVLVYPGPAAGLKEHADEFVRGKDFPANFYLLMDPDFSFTNLYGLRWDAPHETAYPSTFVLDTKRKVLFAKVSKGHGDRAKPDEIVAALPQ